MTRRLPPDVLADSGAAAPSGGIDAKRLAAAVFRDAPAGQQDCALAALYRLRPELGGSSDPLRHERHMWLWVNDDRYFLRVCRLLRSFGVGIE